MRGQKSFSVVISYIIIISAVVFFIFPIVWLGLTSLKPPLELFSFRLPSHLTLENFAAVLRIYDMVQLSVNSFLIAFFVTTLGVLIGAVAAYGFARFKFPLRLPVLIAILVMRMIPGIALTIPLYLMMNTWGLLDTRFAIILAQLGFVLPLSVWIMEGFFRGLPRELDEAALIDGCSRLGALFRVIFPISGPGLAVTAIFTFLFSWNDFGTPLVLSLTPKAQTLPVALSQMNLLYGIRWDHMAAASMMYIIPTVVIAALLGRYIVQGLTLGAVKG
jgi:multiple sugar transport system permease protein